MQTFSIFLEFRVVMSFSDNTFNESHVVVTTSLVIARLVSSHMFYTEFPDRVKRQHFFRPGMLQHFWLYGTAPNHVKKCILPHQGTMHPAVALASEDDDIWITHVRFYRPRSR